MTAQPFGRYRELLIGCGNSRERKVWLPPAVEGTVGRAPWRCLYTIDNDPRCAPNFLGDLHKAPWRCHRHVIETELADEVLVEGGGGILRNQSFDEIHAYEVLEHIGQQGDAYAFFNQFMEIYRLLKPGGYLFATTPSRYSPWLWGDPGHSRAVLPESLTFLSQDQYKQQIGKTAMADYRHWFAGDFDVIRSIDDREHHVFILQAIKPSRIEEPTA